jgi:hypothetical protein
MIPSEHGSACQLSKSIQVENEAFNERAVPI